MTLPSQTVSFHLKSREIREIPLASFRINPDDAEIYWIHLNSLEAPELSSLASTLGIPDESIAEWRSPEAFPEESETEESLTLVLHYWEPPPADKPPPEPLRLILHLTNRCCLTVASGQIPSLERFAATCRREFRFAETPGFILFLVLDYLVDDFTRALRRLEDRSEAIDEMIQRQFSEGLNLQILDLKRQIITLKNFSAALRDTLMRISGRRIAAISENCRQSLGEVYLHAQGLVNQLESLRELANNSLDAYNAAIALRMNQTMRILTVFASIVLPMSLIAGIYGMNFTVLPELGWKYGYPWAIGLMALCGVGLYTLFRKKKWF